jgi:hypothetical protein
MNCMNPWAPAELVWSLRPWPVSSMPMPASKVQGILYRAAAAQYSFLILFELAWMIEQHGGAFAQLRQPTRVDFPLASVEEIGQRHAGHVVAVERGDQSLAELGLLEAEHLEAGSPGENASVSDSSRAYSSA